MKKKLKLAMLAMCVMFPTVSILTACDNHQHILSSDWSHDTQYHWHACMMDDCDVESNKSEHTFGDWIVDKDATLVDEGQKHRKCSTCYYYDYAVVPIPDSVGLEFKLNDDGEGYTLTGIGTCENTVISVPSAYEGKPVTAIGNNAFSTAINGMIFNSLPSLKDLNSSDDDNSQIIPVDNKSQLVPDDDKSLIKPGSEDNEKTQRLNSIQKIYLPDTILSIGDGAFQKCLSLEKVIIREGVKSIGEFAFASCSKLNSITLPETLTSIGESAFSGCTALTAINIPSKVTYIGSNAFSYAESIKRIVLPDSDLKVYYNAFMHMYDLEYVYIGKNTQFIDSGIKYLSDWGHFNESYSIKSYEVHPDNPYYKSVNGDLYSRDGKILIAYAVGKTATNVTIAEGVEHIGDNAFVRCDSLVSVTLPESLKTIGVYAFYLSENLESIRIGRNVTTIGLEAFYQDSAKLNTIIYTGSSAEWDAVVKGKHPDYEETSYDMGTNVLPTCLGDVAGDN